MLGDEGVYQQDWAFGQVPDFDKDIFVMGYDCIILTLCIML